MTESEELIAEVVSTAQMMLRREKDKSKITAALIADKVARAVGNLDDDDAAMVDQAAAVSELIRRFSHWIGKDSVLQDLTGHFNWLDTARKRDWRYWARYASYLERKIPSDVIDALDKSTDGILGLLEDPLREGAWDRRGLVVGHVQSGKTGNYSGLICKAADAGYKIIIVLAGRHNNLRSQTQIRLEESFLGYETSGLDREPSRLIGVGQIDSDLELAPNCMTTRAEHGDFNTKVATHFSASPEKRPWLFVVKKDPTVLRQLLNWIRKKVADATDPEDGRPVVSTLPLLVIDDEADNASVDTA
ncbi:MAG TPA: endonuclease, partial [Devosia sp.]